MHNDYDGELHALRDIVSSLYCLVRDLAENAGLEHQELENTMRRWHQWRTERWEREITDAEAVLTKATQCCDYGYPGSASKFVPQECRNSTIKK